MDSEAISTERQKRSPAPSSAQDGVGKNRRREALRRELERLRRENEELRRRVAEADQQHAEDQKQIADLERQLAVFRKDSSNSSKPPSTDPKKKQDCKQRRYPKREKSRRKPGGQQGHPGKHRPLAPLDQVTEVVAVEVKSCQHCGAVLPAPSDAAYRTEGELPRHQVVEVPPLQPHITEYQCADPVAQTNADLIQG